MVSFNAPPNCSLCPRLCASRLAIVNGYGPLPAQILVVAQAPGGDEERANPPRPLVGWSGRQLRQKLMPLAGIVPDAVRYENIVRCRPPGRVGGDSPPTAGEIAACHQFLAAAIEAAKPAVIITLGAQALRWFFPAANLDRTHGRPQLWSREVNDSITVVPMYHPAATAPGRNPKLVPVMYEDWRRLATVLAGPIDKKPLGDYRLATGAEIQRQLEDLYAVKRQEAVFGFDLETTDPRWNDTFQAHRARPIGFSVSLAAGTGLYTTDSPETIREWLQTNEVAKVCHNAKFEITVLAEMGIAIKNVHCTKVMANILRKSETELKRLTWSEFGLKQTPFGAVDWSDLAAVAQYGAADSDFALRLYHLLAEELRAESLWELYERVERPVVAVISAIERRGVAVEAERLRALADDLSEDRAQTLAALATLFPHDVNWASPVQKAAALFGPPRWTCRPARELKGRLLNDGQAEGVRTGAQTILSWQPPGLGLPVLGQTDGGRPSTDMQFLLPLLPNPTVAAVVRLSSIAQTASQCDKLRSLVQEDGRIHASFHQAGGWEESGPDGREGTDSGRISSSGPNLQQVVHHGDTARPYVAEWGHRAHSAFVAPPGAVLFKADFGQQEPRIGAGVSGDEALLWDLDHGDVYCRVASRVYGRTIVRADVEERQTGKRNFMAWLNGSEGEQFRDAAPWLSKREAEAVAKWIGQQYPVFQAFRDQTVADLRRHGYVRTAFGRRRYLPGIYSPNDSDRRAAAREAIIVPIQGTAADVLKLCMSRLAAHEFFVKDWMRLVLIVHDELVGEIWPPLLMSDGWPRPAVDQLLTTMSVDLLPVRLPVEVGYGRDWDNCRPLAACRPGGPTVDTAGPPVV